MEIVLIANEKGGAGKTATAISLSSALTALGYRVLAVDFDPTGNLSSAVLPEFPSKVLYDVFDGTASVQDAICRTEAFDVLPTIREMDLGASQSTPSFLPANPKSLNQLAARWVGISGAEYNLSSLLRNSGYDLESQYDFVIIDSMPSDGLLTTNAIVAADSILFPCELSMPSFNGVMLVLNGIKTAVRCYHSGIQVDGIVFTKYSEDAAAWRQAIETIRNASVDLGIRCYDTKLRFSREFPRAMDNCIPILDLLQLSSGNAAVDAMNLALEFLSVRGLKPRKEYPGVTEENGQLLFRRIRKGKSESAGTEQAAV